MCHHRGVPRGHALSPRLWSPVQGANVPRVGYAPCHQGHARLAAPAENIESAESTLPVRTVMMRALRRREQPSQQAEVGRGHMAAALPSCFNVDVTLPRLLFLVSPTCEICVAGAMSAAHTVLSLPRTAAFRLYILWLPVLEADTFQAAACVRGCLPEDDRLGHFWDHDLELSRAYYRVLQLGQHPRRPRVAWDLFLLYDAGSVWHADPPVPALWMHQLFLEDVPKLDATVLRRHLEQRLPAEQALPEAPAAEER